MSSPHLQATVSGERGNHFIKMEDEKSSVELLSPLNSVASTVNIGGPPDATLQANNIKRIFQTSSGQYIIIPANGGQAFMHSALSTQANVMVPSPQPVISTPDPITVAKVTSSNVVVRSMPSIVSYQTEVINANSSDIRNSEAVTLGGSRQITSMQVGDFISSFTNQIKRSNSQDLQKESYHIYEDGTIEQLPLSPTHASPTLTNSAINSQPPLSNVTYIQAPLRQVKISPSILRSTPSKSPIIIASNQLQEQPSIVMSDGQLISQTFIPVPGHSISELQQLQDGSQIYIRKVGTEADATIETVTQHVGNAQQQYTTHEGQPPCPICGDKISGYHYGIFTCESCKGFFKRTVQNKKAFICHRKGDCDINVLARKKCPACRFKRCLLAGMKLEAVREDRQRGGRSSYDGAQNYSRARQSLGAGTSSPRQPAAKRPAPTPSKKTILVPTENGHSMLTMMYPEDNKPATLQPHTPTILEDMKAVESLMNEEDADQECCRGKFQDGDDNLFVSLLHFADHCLYKIVRWARNLPDFSSVSTDDQILLLQNCWGELLCLCCCWNSIRCEGEEVRIATGRALNMEIATLLGIEDMTQRLLDFISHLRDLELDSHEFIALKTILLLNPDVKNLRDSSLIRHHQERISSALLIHSSSHYQDKDNKFCQLISRLPELSRLSALGKDILKARQNQGELPQYSLLSELLKGDTAVQT